MQASFVMCFHSARLDNLFQTLRFLVADHLEVVSNCELILLCQDILSSQDQEKLQKSCSCFFEKYRFFQMDLDEMKLPSLTNMGVSCAETERIIVLESDRILPQGYFNEVIKNLKPKVCITTKVMKKLSSQASDEEIRNSQFLFKEEYRSESNQIGMRNMWSGNTAFWKADYMEADMMDENYIGYGWADSDMCRKMEEEGVKNHFWDDIEIHLWHPSATYGVSNQKKLFIDNGIRFCRKWNVPRPDWLLEEIAQHSRIMV